MITLRQYQQESIEALFAYLKRAKDNPLIVLPTGSGKSLALASFVKLACEKHPGTKALIATHRKELIEQDHNALRMVGVDAGIYSAGLGKRQIRDVTIGGIQSLANVRDLPTYNLMIVDEAHLIPTYDQGQYRDLIKTLKEKNEKLRIIGYTATPFRLQGGSLLRGKDKIFHSIAYEKPVQELVAEGYLCPLTSQVVKSQINTSGLKVTRGDFSVSDLEDRASEDRLIMETLDEFEACAKDRKACLFFCISIAHAEIVTMHLRMRGIAAEIVHGGIDDYRRKQTLDRFKSGEFRCLVSVDILTTGFDAPIIDCICLLRPTASCGLYIQMVGRGMRLHSAKSDCLVLDFGGNIARHGPITDPRPKSASAPSDTGTHKDCPKCEAEVPKHKRECPQCGFQFPPMPRQIAHEKTAATEDIMAPPEPAKWRGVMDLEYHEHVKRDGDGPVTMRVDYIGFGGKLASEWVCFEHDGFARAKAVKWWDSHGGVSPCPRTVAEALERVREEIRPTTEILTEKDGKFLRVKDFKLGWAKLSDEMDLPEVPF